ncbi:hypothetical protein DMA15_26635 [Streptomyces sp. WAC 01529]|uniref:DUF6221 family protein n=1 Tax=Streptomyces sp. WAC 01529 TaxID=2203205 RepID=UPI000F6F02C8|nr:DUF6221 family protein [Streptomyces sp. WAC 01529]AZM55722.1 hypothetical protein DMA15_26635 [Streptomyces sp. WAC 01529]
MDDLVQWLGEQLDDDEGIARAATPGPWRVRDDGVVGDEGKHWPVAYTDSHRAREDCLHVAEHDPARVLREIDAKRQALALYTATVEDREALRARMRQVINSDPDEFGKLRQRESELINAEARLRPVVRLLALPYAARPGFRPEWAGGPR